MAEYFSKGISETITKVIANGIDKWFAGETFKEISKEIPKGHRVGIA